MSLRINNHTILPDSPLARQFLVEMGKTIPDWSKLQAIAEGEQLAHSPPAKKRSGPASYRPTKKKKSTTSQAHLRSLKNDIDEFDVPL